MAAKEAGNFEPVRLSLTGRQLAYLEAEAARLGISVSDVVRRILDTHIDALLGYHPPLRPLVHHRSDGPSEEPDAR